MKSDGFVRFDVRVWDEISPLELSYDAEFLYAFLQTCEPRADSKFPGLFRFSLGQIQDRFSRWSLEQCKEVLSELERHGLVCFDSKLRVLWLPQLVFKHIKGLLPKHAMGWRNEWNKMPLCDVSKKAFAAAVRALRSYTEKGGRNHKAKTKHEILEGFLGARPEWYSDHEPLPSYVPTSVDSHPVSVDSVSTMELDFSEPALEPDVELDARELTDEEINEVFDILKDTPGGWTTPRARTEWDGAHEPEIQPKTQSEDSSPPKAQRHVKPLKTSSPKAPAALSPSTRSQPPTTKPMIAGETKRRTSEDSVVKETVKYVHILPADKYVSARMEDSFLSDIEGEPGDTVPTGMKAASPYPSYPTKNPPTPSRPTTPQNPEKKGDVMDSQHRYLWKSKTHTEPSSLKDISSSSLRNLNKKKEDILEEKELSLRNARTLARDPTQPSPIGLSSSETYPKGTHESKPGLAKAQGTSTPSKPTPPNDTPPSGKLTHTDGPTSSLKTDSGVFEKKTTKDSFAKNRSSTEPNKDFLEACELLNEFCVTYKQSLPYGVGKYMTALLDSLHRQGMGLSDTEALAPYVQAALLDVVRGIETNHDFSTKNPLAAFWRKVEFKRKDFLATRISTTTDPEAIAVKSVREEEARQRQIREAEERAKNKKENEEWREKNLEKVKKVTFAPRPSLHAMDKAPTTPKQVA